MQTENRKVSGAGMTPTVNVNLDVSPKKVNMMVDSGAHVSIVNNKVLHPGVRIDAHKRVQITSIHGKEETLGEVGANIVYDSMRIPIKLQVINNCPVPEDGIIGFDVLKPFAVIDGPQETLTWTSDNKDIEIPLTIRRGNNTCISHISTVGSQINQCFNDVKNKEMNSEENDNANKLKLKQEIVYGKDSKNNAKFEVIKQDTTSVNKGLDLSLSEVAKNDSIELVSKDVRDRSDNNPAELMTNFVECMSNNIEPEVENKIFLNEVMAMNGFSDDFSKELVLSKKDFVNEKDTVDFVSEKKFCAPVGKDISSVFMQKKVPKIKIRKSSNKKSKTKGKHIIKRHRTDLDFNCEDGWVTIDTIDVEKGEPPDDIWSRSELSSSVQIYDINKIDSIIYLQNQKVNIKVQETSDYQVCLEPLPLHVGHSFNEEIPARTARHALFPVEMKETVLVHSTECTPGVFIAGGLSSVRDGHIILRIANVNCFSVCLRNPNITIENFIEDNERSFEVCTLKSNSNCQAGGEYSRPNEDLTRFDMLTNELYIDKNWTAEEREFVFGIDLGSPFPSKKLSIAQHLQKHNRRAHQ